MYSEKEIAEMKAHEWGFPFDYALIERLKKVVVPYLATIIQRRYDQTNKFPTSLIYTLKKLEIVKDDSWGINGITLKRTKAEIPAPITTRNQSDFLYVGEHNYAKPFSRIRAENLSMQKHKMFSHKMPFYFYDSNHLWIGNSNHLGLIDASFVPENPIEVLRLQQAGADCFEEFEFKVVAGSLLDGVISLMDKNRPQLMTPDLETEVDVKE